MDVKITNALLSVHNKDGIIEFARALVSMDVNIISTGGTAKTLEDAGINCTTIETITGSPEMMNGRVKSLHPKIHAGILAIRDNPQHAQALKDHNIEPIDLVCINLYPFEQTVSQTGCTLEMAIENIDIGGPTMVRSAAKNYKFVAVVTNPGQYDKVIEQMKNNNGCIDEQMRSDFARIAFGLTACYDSAVANYFNKRASVDFPDLLAVAARKQMPLRYGENPHQAAAFYKLPDTGEPSISSAKFLEGSKNISFNNLLDANAAFELVKEFTEAAAVVVKHNNPCGCSVDEDIKIAYQKAYEGDVVSAFGGVIALNRSVDSELAQTIMESYSRFGKARGAGGFFAEVIIAPEFDANAIEIIRTLKGWGSRVSLLQTGSIDRSKIDVYGPDIRCIVGGLLIQKRDLIGWEPQNLTYPTKAKPTDKQLEDLRIGWLVAKHTKSNAIVLVKNKKVVGVGAGQMNRIESGIIAVQKAGEEAKGSCLASDAFFPFADNVDNAAKAGVAAIVQPGGSQKDDEVIAAADNYGIAIVFTAKRHFKH